MTLEEEMRVRNVAYLLYGTDNTKRSWRMPDGRAITLNAGEVKESTCEVRGIRFADADAVRKASDGR